MFYFFIAGIFVDFNRQIRVKSKNDFLLNHWRFLFIDSKIKTFKQIFRLDKNVRLLENREFGAFLIYTNKNFPKTMNSRRRTCLSRSSLTLRVCLISINWNERCHILSEKTETWIFSSSHWKAIDDIASSNKRYFS